MFLGVHMVTAAYSPEGAALADAQMVHLDRNRRTFDAGIAEIPGLWSMPLQSTYLAWVDFSGTGMDQSEVDDRLKTKSQNRGQRRAWIRPRGRNVSTASTSLCPTPWSKTVSRVSNTPSPTFSRPPKCAALQHLRQPAQHHNKRAA